MYFLAPTFVPTLVTNKPNLLAKVILSCLVMILLFSTFGGGSANVQAAPLSANPAPGQWLNRINYYRAQAGLPAVTEDANLSAGDAQETNYLLLNPDDFRHDQDSHRSGYTQAGQKAAQQSNLFGGGGHYSDAQAIDSWMESPLHRFGILLPQLTRVGYALACDTQRCFAALNILASTDGTTTKPDGVVYPGDGQQGVRTGYLTWQYGPFEAQIQFVNATVKDSAGQPVAFTLEPQGGYFNLIILKIDGSQDYGAGYTVTIGIKQNGQSHSRSWSFTSSPPPPVLTNASDPAFAQLWGHTDAPVAGGLVARSWIWGSQQHGFASVLENYDGKQRLVQYHDKARMEVNNPNLDRANPFFVSNGLLVREMISGQLQVGDSSFVAKQPANVAVTGDPTNPKAPTYNSFRNLASLNNDRRVANHSNQSVSTALNQAGSTQELANLPADVKLVYYDDHLGHNIPDVFWNFMNSRGLVLTNGSYQQDTVVNWVYAMGYPLSEPYWTKTLVGGVERDVLVQVFERRVLSYTPSNPASFQVEMGNVGQHYYAWRYGSAPDSKS